MKKLPIVTAHTSTGKILVFLLRSLLRLVHTAKKRAWQRPPQYFHDDPRHYTRRDLIFFAYKYYFKPPLEDDAQGAIEDFFKQNPPVFEDKKLLLQKEITLSAAGDLMPYEWIQPEFCPHLWDDIAANFFAADIRFANLETPIDLSKPAALVPEVMLNDMNFNGSAAMFDVFNAQNLPPQYLTRFEDKKHISFDVLSTANNHSLDMGESGVHATLDFLEEKNILAVGTSHSAEARLDFPIIEKNGIRVAFIAYTFSMNQYTNPSDKDWLVNHLEVNQPEIDLFRLKKDVFFAKTVKKADFVVLSLHYGNAYQTFPGGHIVENTQRIFDECGVDIILGGHAHNVQPMARYDFSCPLTQRPKAGFVLFAFGDFVAYDIFNWCHLSVFLKLTLAKGFDTEGVQICYLKNVEPTPVYANGVFKNKKTRDLRFLDAKKWLKKLETGKKPDFMTDWNVQELRHLMDFYKKYFEFNLCVNENQDF